MKYQARLSGPIGMIGICCDSEALIGIDFLGSDTSPKKPLPGIAQDVYEQLKAYFIEPDFSFDLILNLGGTVFQRRVWQVLSEIPFGQTRSYGDLAAELGSSARAIGQACGANRIPIVIPCHRVVSKSGIGGFMHQSAGHALDIKNWLLTYETQSSQKCRVGRNVIG